MFSGTSCCSGHKKMYFNRTKCYFSRNQRRQPAARTTGQRATSNPPPPPPYGDVTHFDNPAHQDEASRVSVNPCASGDHASWTSGNERAPAVGDNARLNPAFLGAGGATHPHVAPTAPTAPPLKFATTRDGLHHGKPRLYPQVPPASY